MRAWKHHESKAVENQGCLGLKQLSGRMQEAGRLFCSKCGNAALQKVEVVIGTDGTEQFGVRKKHIIRGTKFPLPKPHVSPMLILTSVALCMRASLGRAAPLVDPP